MLKIFAIRDRMLNYFQPPIIVSREQDLLAALARGINGPQEERNEISNAPDHYEVWQIGEVDDQGHLSQSRSFVINCASLIRNGVWNRSFERTPSTDSGPDQNKNHTGDATSVSTTGLGPTAGTTKPTPITPQEPPEAPGRSHSKR